MTEGNKEGELMIRNIRGDLVINLLDYSDYNKQLTEKIIEYINKFINIPSYADNSRLIARLLTSSAGLDEILKKIEAALLVSI